MRYRTFKNALQCPNRGVGIVRGKYCPHCHAVIPSDAKTCPQCKKPIPAPKEKKPLTKRWWFWTAAVVLVLGIIGNISNAVNGGEEAPPTLSSSFVSSQPEANPFLQPETQAADVMNGFRTEKLGQWACIHMEKAEAKAAGEDAFSEFAKTNVQGSGYNWWSVIFEDGTGICFTGSHTYVSTYGRLDDEGCITEALGDISLDTKTSRTIYTPRKEKPSPTPSPRPSLSPHAKAYRNTCASACKPNSCRYTGACRNR